MHIFTASSALVGVCLTVIGIIQLLVHPKFIDTLADDFLAFDALVFLAACLLSYFALRKRSIKRLHRIEAIADILFIIALSFMAFICVFIVFSISIS